MLLHSDANIRSHKLVLQIFKDNSERIRPHKYWFITHQLLPVAWKH